MLSESSAPTVNARPALGLAWMTRTQGARGPAARVKDLVPLGVLIALFFLYTITATISDTVFQLPGVADHRLELTSVFPQAWEFFSRSPRDVRYEPYVLGQGQQVLSLSKWPASAASNMLGLPQWTRSGRRGWRAGGTNPAVELGAVCRSRSSTMRHPAKRNGGYERGEPGLVTDRLWGHLRA